MKKPQGVREFLVIGLLITAASACSTGDAAEPTEPRLEVPAACLEALAWADRVMLLAGDGFEVLSDVLFAASRLDVAAMNRGNAQLESLTPIMSAAEDDYRSAAEACRAEA